MKSFLQMMYFEEIFLYSGGYITPASSVKFKRILYNENEDNLINDVI